MKNRPTSSRALLAAAVLATTLPHLARADLSFTVEATGWDSDTRRNAAISALTNITARYNAYGDFGGYNIYAYYNAGIPTAQSGYGGWGGSIGYGGTWPNDRVTLHESNHYLGSGTYGHTYNGTNAIIIGEQFEGVGFSFGTDGTHFWPYGMNYDSEWSELAARRNVALLYAFRQDWGIGNAANPTAWNAASATLTGSDAVGDSSFNTPWGWSDGTFAHPNADYATGAFAMRTPATASSWNFAGKSLTVNSGGSLLFNSWGTTGVTTFKTLTLQNGATVRHDQNAQDTFQLSGSVSLTGAATFNANRGPIQLYTASLSGAGSLTKSGPYPLTLATPATYTGDTTISSGILRLDTFTPVANYTFDSVSGTTVNNTGSGGSAMNGALTGSAAIVAGGHSGNAVSLSGGASVDINNTITKLGPSNYWTVSAWIKTSTAGSTLLSKSDGGWGYGNTIFYLGDGTDAGSGGIPSAVRYAGGFYQGSTSASNLANNQWHMVTYTNAAGAWAIYADGNTQPLSSGNSSLGAPDWGSIVRLGYTTDTYAGDGTVHFNGLMDDVRFYNQALSSSQVSSLYQNNTVSGSLPTNTNVSIAAGASLDLNNTNQQIGSLSGPANSAITLGSGKLTVNSSATTTFGGAISGAGGSFTKSGTGTLTLTAAHAYTGATTISGGTLRLDSANVSAVHRWSFNNSLADSVGNANASIVDVGANNATLSATKVTLAGGAANASDYVSLGSGLIPKNNTPVTLELWATPNAIQNWSRIFDLGTGTGENLFMSWTQGTTLASDRVEWKDAATNTVNNSVQPYVLGTEYHIVMVLNPVGNSTQVTWYAAPSTAGSLGSAKGTFTSTNTLADFYDSADNLGASFYGDNTASASYDEVRFWNGALSASTLQTLHLAGPDANLASINQLLSSGQLPSTTDLNISAPGAALDLNNLNQTVASLSGVSGSSLLLGSATFTVNGTASTTFAGNISGTGALIKNNTGALTLSGNNTYTGPTTVNFGALRFDPTQNASSSFTLNGGTTTLTSTNAALAKPVALANTAQLDLGNNALVVATTDASDKSSKLATLASQIASAKNGGSWNGNGITSSLLPANPNLTLALVDNADLNADAGLASINGAPLTPASLIVIPALLGDANLDKSVDLADYDAWFTHVGTGTAFVTSSGDFNQDGNIDLADYDTWFTHVGASFPVLSAAAPVPEPASLTLLALTAGIFLLKRRRAQN